MRLRRVLGADAIETVPDGYRLVVPGDEVDARRFERLVGRARELLTLGEPERAGALAGEALGLWRGRPLVISTGGTRAGSRRLASKSCASTPRSSASTPR